MAVTRRAKIDTPFRTDEEIIELVQKFEECRWPYERWTHRAHLAVAAAYLTEHPFEVALSRIRDNIQAYNRTCGDADGYHETITVFFLRLVSNFLKTDRDNRSLAAAVDQLFLHCDMTTPLEYYSHERLWSPDARRQWIEPDLKPLPF